MNDLTRQERKTLIAALMADDLELGITESDADFRSYEDYANEDDAVLLRCAEVQMVDWQIIGEMN